jgi:hypothetical protein
MLITNDFVFIHLPKTGGDFIRTLCKQHLPEGSIVATDLAKHAADDLVPADYAHLPRFGLIRNPWSWYVSWYHYHMGSGRTEEHKARVNNPVWTYVTEDGTSFDFERIVTKLVTGDVPNAQTAGRLRSGDIDLLTDRYVTTFRDGLTHDRITIGCTETMRSDFPRFLEENGIAIPASLREAIDVRKKLNVTKHAPYQEHYSSPLRELVGHKARQIIERYGYQFEPVSESENAGATG